MTTDAMRTWERTGSYQGLSDEEIEQVVSARLSRERAQMEEEAKQEAIQLYMKQLIAESNRTVSGLDAEGSPIYE